MVREKRKATLTNPSYPINISMNEIEGELSYKQIYFRQNKNAQISNIES